MKGSDESAEKGSVIPLTVNLRDQITIKKQRIQRRECDAQKMSVETSKACFLKLVQFANCPTDKIDDYSGNGFCYLRQLCAF